MTSLEKKIIKFIEDNRKILFLGIITLIALVLRYKLLNFQSGDYIYFLRDWFQHFRLNGGLKALANYPGDYNVPYMTLMSLISYIPVKDIYLIKLLSILFDFLLAFGGALLAKELVNGNKKMVPYFTYIAILFLPQIILNSSCWGQCDSIYSSFCIFALYFLLKEKYVKSFIFLGIAFSFKLQFIFLLPVFIILYFSKKKFSIFNFLIIPVVDFILCLPAIIAGKPIFECLMVYFNQTQTYPRLQLNFINIYQIINDNCYYVIKPVSIIFVLGLCAFVLFYVLEKRIKWNDEKIITFTLWFLVVLTFLLPSMHERYLFVGEILSIIYYISYRKNKMIVAIINVNALLTYFVYLFGFSSNIFPIIAIIYLFIILHFTENTFELLNSKDG